jgi:hypothetical protein
VGTDELLTGFLPELLDLLLFFLVEILILEGLLALVPKIGHDRLHR